MKKVLIVDDYEDIHDVLTFVLEEEQLEVKCLTSPDLLCEHLQQWKPDLLMLDVRLGNIDGRSLCDEIKANPLYSHIKIALMSAMAEGWHEVPCKADAKINKPFDIDEVKNVVLELLGLVPQVR